MDVVIREDLCEGEKDFIQKRLQTVKRWTQYHGIPCRDNHLPRVALLGSGGGQRAQIAFLGVLWQLAECDLLDSVLYLAGVSGSTWAMSSLYDDAHWPDSVDRLVRQALADMSQDRSSSFSDCIEWLNNRSQEGDLSLTDFWGVVVCYIKGVQLEKRTLAKEGQRDKDGATPYPLYSAVERALLDKNAEEEPWFEVSPHQAGFTEPGAFVETALLKQPFQGGKVQMDSRRKPMDMVQLQGICGSAFGDSQINIKYIWGLIKNWFHEHWPVADHDHNPFYGPVFKLLDDFGDMERSYDDLQELKIELHDFCGSHIHSDALTTLVPKTWDKMTEVQKRKYITTILDELNQSLNPSLRMKLKATYSLSWWDASKLLMKALSLVYNWDFGEMPNILYKLRDRWVPLGMCEKDIMHVIDAGLYLNSPYPPLLGKKRDIDLIISFDFSEGDPFETVKNAHHYAERCKVPFPEINLDGTDDDCPKSLYIFEGRDKLTVIHIPLFNIDNCKDCAGINRERQKYTTFQKPYRNLDMINHLAELAAKNVKINKDAILKEIRKAAQRRN